MFFSVFHRESRRAWLAFCWPQQVCLSSTLLPTHDGIEINHEMKCPDSLFVGERQNNIRHSFIRETLPVLQPEIKFYFDDGLKPGSCLRSTLLCCVQLLSLLSVLHDRMKITVHWHTRSALATWSSWLKWDGLSRVKLQHQKKGNGQIKVVITCAGWICMQA